MMRLRWHNADTPEARDAMRGWFLRDWWRENSWKPGVDPELLDEARSKILQGRAPEGVWATMGRELATHTVPAVGAAAGGIGAVAAGSLVGASETGVGAVALDLAGGAAGGMAADALLRHTMGDAWTRQNEEQLAANEKANPIAASIGKMVPFLISALGGQGKKVIDGGGRLLGRAATRSGEKAIRFAAARGMATKLPMVERMARNVASFERAGLSEALQQRYVEGRDVSVMDAVARSAAQAVAMGAVPPPAVSGAVGFFPAAKEVLLHAGWRGVTDGAAMTLSSAIYDATVHGKALAWGDCVDARGRTIPGIRTELGANLPAFVLQHILMGGAHRLLPGKAAEAPFTRAASDSSSPAKNPFRPRPRNVIDAEILREPAPGKPARLSAPATDETRSNGPARLPAPANDTPRPPAHPPEMILNGTDPARLVGMHPAEYKQWLVEHLDLTPAGEISSAAQLASASTAITAARGRGDKPTEQILTGQLHAARQPTDWTPEKLAAQGVEVTPEAVADLNARAEAFNQSLGEKKSWLGLLDNPPGATVRVSNTATTATPSAPVVTGGLETIPFPPDPVSSPVHAPVHPAEVFDTNGTVIPASSQKPVLPPPVGFPDDASPPPQQAHQASEDIFIDFALFPPTSFKDSPDIELAKMAAQNSGDTAKGTPNSSLKRKKNAGGGIKFEESDLYRSGPNEKNTVKIKYTGGRKGDYKEANIAAGIGKTQKVKRDYTWHHLDDYDPITGMGTMQLVRTDVHAANSHKGGVHQYEKATGQKYKN